MAEYIEREALKNNLHFTKEGIFYHNGKAYMDLNIVDKIVLELPTADVVPRADVEKEIVGYIEKHLQYQRKKIDVPFRSRDMRNYQCGAIDVIEYFEELVAALKKKYTEDK